MRTMRSTRLVALASVCAVAALSGCDDPIQTGVDGTRPAGPAPVVADPGAPGEAGGAPGEPGAPGAPPADAGVPDAGLTYPDEAFVEIDIVQRDPFRRFRPLVLEVETPPSTKLSDTSVDEMRLIGIITGSAGPRAMILDRNGLGITVRPRDYIGRPEAVQVGGSDGVAVPLVWRVDRIQTNEVVLSRNNPATPDEPPLMRTLTLRSEEQMNLMNLGEVLPFGENETPVVPTIPTAPSGR